MPVVGEGAGLLGKTIVFLAESRFSPPLADQRKLCVASGDRLVLASDVRFTDLTKATARHRRWLERGDRLKLYDLNSLGLAQQTVIRMLTKLLQSGIIVEIVSEDLIATPEPGDPTFRCLALLDAQQRAVHAIKIHQPDGVRGRKNALKDEQWPAIKAQLDAPDVQVAKVAAALGVGRTTLHRFVTRMRAAETSAEKAVD